MARIIDVIEAPNQQKDEMVRRVPEYGSGDFRFGSQVIVREFQAAVFFRDGKSYDVFGPGRHTITTANAPLLSDLIRRVTAGKDVFTAEVYFVNMTEFIDQKWGTSEPIALRDTDLGLVRLRAFGTFSMQVGDPALFVNKIVGGQGLYQTEQIARYLRGIIVAKLTDMLGELGRGLFDLPQLYDEIAAGARAKVQDDFGSFGIQLKTHLPAVHQGTGVTGGIAGYVADKAYVHMQLLCLAVQFVGITDFRTVDTNKPHLFSAVNLYGISVKHTDNGDPAVINRSIRTGRQDCAHHSKDNSQGRFSAQ